MDAAECSQVTGLQFETTPVEYRHGDRATFAPGKMPGLSQVGHVALMMTVRNERSEPKMTWLVRNAWPVNSPSNRSISRSRDSK